MTAPVSAGDTNHLMAPHSKVWVGTLRGSISRMRSTLLSPISGEPPRHGVPAVFRRLRSDQDWTQAIRLRLATYPEDDTPARWEHTARQMRTARSVCERGAGAWFGAFVGERKRSELAGHRHRHANPLRSESPYQRGQLVRSAFDAVVRPVVETQRAIAGEV